MASPSRRRREPCGRNPAVGFTLIELMIVVAILGILAALAVPSFIHFLRKAKTSEVSANLGVMFEAAASYYNAVRTSGGMMAAESTYCAVPTDPPYPPPIPAKRMFQPTASDIALGFSIADEVYFSYHIKTNPDSGDCGHLANQAALYTFSAHGDLDGDGAESTFELAVGSDDANQLYRARGFYVVNATE